MIDASKILANGGATYNPATDTEPTKGYAVSSFKQHERVFPVESFGDRNIRQYLARRKPLFQDSRICLGAWVDSDKVFLDCSVVVKTIKEARRICREHNQLAFFNLAKLETVRV